MSKQHCKECDCEMEFIHCDDNPSQRDESKAYAYNLYACDNCGTVMKDSVWNNTRTWIYSCDDISKESRDGDKDCYIERDYGLM